MAVVQFHLFVMLWHRYADSVADFLRRLLT